MTLRRNHKRHGESVTAVPAIDEQVLKRLLDGLKVGIAYLASSGRILYCNPSFVEFLGRPPRLDLTGFNLSMFVSAAGWRPLSTALREARHGAVEGQLRIDSGSETRFLRLHLGPLHTAAFAGAEIHATAIETTDVMDANAALQEREHSLQSLPARILKVQDEERRRIARDLHDVTGQEIAAISMGLGSLLSRCDSSKPELAKGISDSMNLLRRVENEIRTLSYVLHPPLLDERGLGSALEWYVDGFRKRSGIEVKLTMSPNLERLPVEKEIALFRIVQEGLTNVLRHSGSTKAEISLTVTDSTVELSVLDEGVGISPEKLAYARAKHAVGSEFGVGVPGMRERLSQLGGSLELQPRRLGTRLVARVPINHTEAQPDSLPPAQSLGGGYAVPEFSNPAAARKRILVADDHEVVRQGVRALLEQQPNWEVCGEASDGLEAISRTKELRPDVVVLDLTMPGVGGLSAAQQIRAAGISTRLLAFTTHDYPGLERLIKAAGCDGYIQKGRAGEDLITGIRSVLEGEPFFPSLTRQPSKP